MKSVFADKKVRFSEAHRKNVMTLLKFTFRFQKTLQAAAYLLLKADKRLNYMHVIKLLYIADREYLAEEGDMITGDSCYALNNGPVLSGTYNLIKNKHPLATQWKKYIQTDHYDLLLIESPGDDELCAAEKEKLDSVYGRYDKNYDVFDLVGLTHEYSEWEKNHRTGTSTLIPVEDILDAQNKSELIPIVAETLQMEEYNNRLFGTVQ